MKFLPILLVVIAVFLPAVSFAGIGPCDYSTASQAYPGPETVVVMVLPGGEGMAMSAAQILYGEVDATITLTLMDCLGNPVASYPSEDLWLESVDGGLSMCPGGTTADANTDANGNAVWEQPLNAGGSSQALTTVMVSGMALYASAGLDINYNSPDINGDLVVNLLDVPMFAGDFYGGVYRFRSDFYYDTVNNLSDVVKMAQGLGSACP